MTTFKKSICVILAALIWVSAARADNVGIDMSGTSPSTVTTAAGYTTSTELGQHTTCSIYAILTGATGGTLDVYIQTAFRQVNATPVWVDVVHFPQIAAAAAAAGFSASITRWSPTTSSIQTGLNTTSGTPVLAVNTVVPGVFGFKFRTVYKTGAGTTLGAAQTILAYCSGT